MTPNEREQLEALLPWHAARTLSPAEAKRVEEALASNQELARHFALVREEMAETVAVNEALGTPSARALDKLLAAIDADQARYPRAALGGILARFLARLSPRTLAWSAAIAGLVIVLEAGAIATFLIGQRDVTYETASVPPPAAPLRSAARGVTHEAASAPAPAAPTALANAATGFHVLVRFAPDASAADVTRFLEANKASVVDGPKPGGLYRLRVAAGDKAEVVKVMQANKLIGFIAPE